MKMIRRLLLTLILMTGLTSGYGQGFIARDIDFNNLPVGSVVSNDQFAELGIALWVEPGVDIRVTQIDPDLRGITAGPGNTLGISFRDTLGVPSVISSGLRVYIGAPEVFWNLEASRSVSPEPYSFVLHDFGYNQYNVNAVAQGRGLAPPDRLDITFNGTGGLYRLFLNQPIGIPEPASASLIGIGLASLLIFRRRK